MQEEYRIVDYDGEWFVEKQSAQGVWKILKNCNTKQEAEQYLASIKGGNNG